MKKLTENEATQIFANRHILAYVVGLGFGLMSGAFSLVNVLADSAGPGTVGFHHEPPHFFMMSSLYCLVMILLHPCWGILAFDALDRRRPMPLLAVLASHLTVSCLVRKSPPPPLSLSLSLCTTTKKEKDLFFFFHFSRCSRCSTLSASTPPPCCRRGSFWWSPPPGRSSWWAARPAACSNACDTPRACCAAPPSWKSRSTTPTECGSRSNIDRQKRIIKNKKNQTTQTDGTKEKYCISRHFFLFVNMA